MNPYLATLIGSGVRWLLTAWGAQGVLSDDQTTQLVGAVSTVAALAWSLWQKHRADAALDRARATGL